MASKKSRKGKSLKRTDLQTEITCCTPLETKLIDVDGSLSISPPPSKIILSEGWRGLRLEKIEYTTKGLMFTADNFLSVKECEQWIRFAEAATFVQVVQRRTHEFALREHGRLQIIDNEIAEKIYSRLQNLIPADISGSQPVCCSPNIRLYRYCPGERFGKHIDESTLDERSGCMSKLTVLIYFSNHCEGGETLFYTGRNDETLVLSVAPVMGRLLVHEHGAKCLTHEGSPVHDGVKFVLRTDVVYS